MKWFLQLISGNPHFYIGGINNPYLLRWYIIPRNKYFNIYLHKFMRDDDDRAMHDHPWWFVSIMLWGSYLEYTANGLYNRAFGSIAFRKAEHKHIVKLKRDNDGNILNCWTLVFTGAKVREWGFHCPKGFVPWYDFVDNTDKGNIGKGCE